MEARDILPILAMIMTVVGLVYQYFGIILKIKEDNAREFGEIRSKLSSLETKTELFWKCIESKVVDVLKSYPSNLGKDILLDKLKEKSLTLTEAERLRTILDCELQGASEKKFAYVLILGRIEQLIYELRKEGNDKGNINPTG